MASTSEIARRYFEALSAHELETALQCWQPGGLGRFVNDRDIIAPEGHRAYFSEVFGAFPDFRLEILDLTTARNRTAVRWRATGTFAGPGSFQGFAPSGARIAFEGCDMVTVTDGLITRNDAYVDQSAIARQLGVLPPAGSKVEQRMTALANVRTRVADFFRGAEPERIADGVWLVRGGRPRTMNVYLIADDGGVTMFDAGISDMSGALRSISARFGGLKQVVLGHADCDHRGAAPAQDVPVLCHPAERQAAESDAAFRPYWDLTQLAPYARPVYRRLLQHWDGGAVTISRTLSEGDEVAGFRVVELPGHAPGLIGLFREADRLALVSDCFYTIDPLTGRKNAAHVPHPAFNHDTDQARTSIRKLAALEPAIAWAGHTEPVRGPDIVGQLERAAASPA